WPEGLSHYVRDHFVALPDEFIQHVRAGTTRIPKAQWSSLPVDTDFWKDWCRRNTLGHLKDRIAQAKLRADQEVGKLIAAEVTKLEAKHGVSRQPCQWRGCGKVALKGRAFCARCCFRGQEPLRFFEPYHDLSILNG